MIVGLEPDLEQGDEPPQPGLVLVVGAEQDRPLDGVPWSLSRWMRPQICRGVETLVGPGTRQRGDPGFVGTRCGPSFFSGIIAVNSSRSQP
jgi:hypothetical protein